MPTFRNTLSVPSSKAAAFEDGTDRVFRNVGIYKSDAGESPKRKQTTFWTWRKLEINNYIIKSYFHLLIFSTYCHKTFIKLCVEEYVFFCVMTLCSYTPNGFITWITRILILITVRTSQLTSIKNFENLITRTRKELLYSPW